MLLRLPHGAEPARSSGGEKSKFEKYTADDLYQDLFIDGPDDIAIVQSTYFKDFYKEGYNTIERNATVAAKYPDRFIVNGA